MSRVIVYKNLRRGDWSIAALKGARGRGPLIGHAAEVVLADVDFHVSEATRQTVVAKRERSVHAYAIGTLVEASSAECGARVSYNPFRGPHFTTDDGAAVTHAETVIFAADGKAYLPCG